MDTGFSLDKLRAVNKIVHRTPVTQVDVEFDYIRTKDLAELADRVKRSRQDLLTDKLIGFSASEITTEIASFQRGSVSDALTALQEWQNMKWMLMKLHTRAGGTKLTDEILDELPCSDVLSMFQVVAAASGLSDPKDKKEKETGTTQTSQ